MAGSQAAIQKLKHSFDGEVSLPGEDAYVKASATLLAKGEPAVVALPNNAQDIAKALDFARVNGLTVSVRNGGHSLAGHSTNNGGLVIDMRHLSRIDIIDESRRIVRVGAGATWEMVANALQPHGWAISAGDTKTVGVGGLTLAGGIGWLVRRDGLAIDNLLAAELVMADGQALRASATEHPGLFWAIRGGGGNFGVATYFEFAAQPVSHVFAGTIHYDMQGLPKVLRGWRDYMRTAPDELTSTFLVMPANPMFGGMPATALVMLCYAGGEEAGVMKALEPLLKIGTVTNHDIKRKPYASVLEDPHVPHNVKVITNNAFVHTLSDGLIDTICNNPGIMLQIRSVGGAMNRVAADATAFAHRDSEALIVAPNFLPLDASEAAITEALTPWRSILAFASGAYASFFSQDTPEAIAAAYPAATYQKLAHIKRQYDPENIFNQNYNIAPLGELINKAQAGKE